MQSNRGYDPTFCVLEECGYMKPAAVASALTYATNHGVSLLFLCSTVPSEHWLSRMSEINRDGVKLIEVKYLCDSCAAKGCTGVCVHGELKMPAHIEASSESDLVKQAMDLVMPGSYQLEVCGSNLHTASTAQAAFDPSKVDQIRSRQVDLREDVETVYVALDPVQAGSGLSGIGLCVVGRLASSDSFVVSNILALVESNRSFSAEKGLLLFAVRLVGRVTVVALTVRIAPNSCPSVSYTVVGG